MTVYNFFFHIVTRQVTLLPPDDKCETIDGCELMTINKFELYFIVVILTIRISYAKLTGSSLGLDTV